MVGRLRDKFRWHANEWVIRRLAVLNAWAGRLAVVSQFTTPGDTLLTATVGHIIKRCWPRLQLNAVVHQPELLRSDPHFAEINGPRGPWQLTFHYLPVLADRRADVNVLRPTMDLIGITDYEYRARVFLALDECATGRARVAHLHRPIVAVNLMSREPSKTWPLPYWRGLIQLLSRDFDVIQLGDDSEPLVEGVTRFAGRLSLRESMAVLGCSRVHVGPVSFLMHAANGLGVPAVIIYGGRETPANSGYACNRNVYTAMPCGPCWIHAGRGEHCRHEMACMAEIRPAQVYAEIQAVLSGKPARNPDAAAAPRRDSHPATTGARARHPGRAE